MNIIDFKIVVLGPKNVGKTSLLNKYFNKETNQVIQSTKNLELLTSIIKYRAFDINLMFWDTPGEQFEEEIRSLLSGSQGIIFVYDLTNPKTFEDLKNYFNLFLNTFPDDEKINSPFLLLGNKVDLIQKEENEDSLLSKQVVEFCAKSATIIHENVSAKSGEGVTQAFEKLFNLILDLQNENFKLKEKILLKSQQFMNSNKKELQKTSTSMDEIKVTSPVKPPTLDEIKLSSPMNPPSMSDNDEEQPFKKVTQGNLIIDLNDESKTATITGINPSSEIFIPRSIQFKSHDYLITKFEPVLSPNFNKIKSIKFDKDSAIQELKKKFIDLFHDVKTITLPNNIIKIEESLFIFHDSLENIQFYSDSNLEIIESKAFHKTGLKIVQIPQHVKRICEKSFSLCFYLEEFHAVLNSELQIIEKNVFSNTQIKKLSIPSSMVKFEEGWCQSTKDLTDIKIIKNQKENIMYYDDKFILGKSNLESDVFDILYFARRDVKTATIPEFIREIAPFAFERCNKLEIINIPSDSQLKIIGKDAFCSTTIKSISIPLHLTSICRGAFSSCMRLQSVEIPPNSELKTIDSFAFDYSSIESISIPLHVTSIREGAFSFCRKLKRVDIPQNSELENIEKDAFQNTQIEKFSIPHHITTICEDTFSNCMRLKEVEFMNILRLNSIKKGAFYHSRIECFTLSPHITKICYQTFSECFCLKKIVLMPNMISKLQVIEKNAFYLSAIESIEIPSNILYLNEGWCNKMQKLIDVKIIPNDQENIMYYDNKFIIGKSDLKSTNFDILYFARRDIQTATIPPFIKQISPYAFNGCKNLDTIETQSIPSSIPSESIFGGSSFSYCENLRKFQFPSNTRCIQICMEAFAHTSIVEISIPASIREIANNAFAFCSKLKKVVFPADSQLLIIGNNAFNSTSIESFDIPSRLQIVGEYSFFNCLKLRRISIPMNSRLKRIRKSAFVNSRIESFYVPSLLNQFDLSAFASCKNLRKFVISEDSNLQSFDLKIFTENMIKSLCLPSHVTSINIASLYINSCQNLEIIEINENSQLKEIYYLGFKKNTKVIIMIPTKININQLILINQTNVFF